MALGQQPQPQILRDIGVLVLVDQNVTEAVLVIGQHLGVGGEQRKVMQQQIAEVAGVERQQPRLILAVDIEHLAAREIAGVGRADLVGDQPPVLEPLDHRQHGARRPALVVDIGRRHQLFHEPRLVVGVEDGEIGLEPDNLGVAAQDACGQRVESADPEPLDRVADLPADAVAHLARRLVCERHGKQLAGPGAARDQNMREPGGQHAGLAGAGAGEHQQRPIDGLDRVALFVIQSGEIGRGRRHGRAFGGHGVGHRGIIPATPPRRAPVSSIATNHPPRIYQSRCGARDDCALSPRRAARIWCG